MSEPAFLNVQQASDLLGVSVRTFHTLRARGMVGAPLEFGPRSVKWPRDELIEAAKTLTPRRVGMKEPPELARARNKRAA